MPTTHTRPYTDVCRTLRAAIPKRRRAAAIIGLLTAYMLACPVAARGGDTEEFLLAEPPKTTTSSQPHIYVPYEDLARLIDPEDKAMLMDRDEFEKLLVAARENAETADTLPLGQVTQAHYAADIEGETLSLKGRLTVISLSTQPVAVPLGFANLGLNKLLLDGKPAPLGYDKQGKLTLILTRKATHILDVQATAKLKELETGGMHFSVALPPAVAARINLTAAGDLDIHANVPASKPAYDKQADQTSTELTIGAQERVTVVLLGNGRRQQDRPILLAESASNVHITRSHQVLSSLHTVQVLRRGARELQFQLPANWTVTEVTCPGLVRWSISEPPAANQPLMLTVRLRSAEVGTTAVHIKAVAETTDTDWLAPNVTMPDAAFQRGCIIVEPDEELRIRAEKLTNAAREDPTAVSVTGISAAAAGQLYFHWGKNWAVCLRLETAKLRRSIEEKQNLVLTRELVTLTADCRITAIERELFDVSFIMPPRLRKWHLADLRLNGRDEGFEYTIEDRPHQSLLRMQLARPVMPEKTADVQITLQHVPQDWYWSADAAPQTITVPLVRSQAQNVSGRLAVSTQGDLDAEPQDIPENFEHVPPGRMSRLDLPQNARHAYSYKNPPRGHIRVRVSRRRPRIAADSIGLIDIRPEALAAQFQINYDISRASAQKLYLLAHKSLKEKINITSSGTPLSSKNVVPAGERTFPLPSDLLLEYDLWVLNLDSLSIGDVRIDASYEIPLPEDNFDVALVRPICPAAGEDHAGDQTGTAGNVDEFIAVQASELLALTINTDAAKSVDAIDLPPRPAEAGRILAAYHLEAPATPGGQRVRLNIGTTVHENYEIPAALVLSENLTTYLDVRGRQRTDAHLKVANAGCQFFTFRLPPDANLWSLRVGDEQAKPQIDAQDNYKIPLERSREPIAIRIVYDYAPADANLNSLRLALVDVIGAQRNTARWRVVPPPGFCITSQETEMQTADLEPPAPAYIHVYNFIADNLLTGAFIFMPCLSRVREMAPASPTSNNLRSIANAVHVYRNDNNGRWPNSLERLVEHGYITRKQLYDSKGKRLSYFPPPGSDEVAEDTILAQSGPINGYRVMAYADAHVDTEPVGVEAGGYYGDRADIGGEFQYQRVRTSAARASGQAGIAPQELRQLQPQEQQVLHFKVERKAGRFTLPVDLLPTVAAGPTVIFTALGTPRLVIGLERQTRQNAAPILGFALVLLIGVSSAMKRAREKAAIIVLILAAASLLAIMSPSLVRFANGAFMAALCLVPLYIIIWLGAWLWPKLSLGPVINTQTAAFILAALILTASTETAQAARRVSTGLALPQPLVRVEDQHEPASELPPTIFPYEDDPTEAERTEKVLIPYSRFVELWNQAHPEDRIDQVPPAADISFANVRYNAAVENKRLTLTLTADLQTYAADWVPLSLPMRNLAVTDITFDGAPAKWQGTPRRHARRQPADDTQRTVIMLPPQARGLLKLTAVGTPDYFGRRGQIAFSLPPLPAPVMDVILPEPDLQLEADNINTVLERTDDGQKAVWTLPLAMVRDIKLRWLPKTDAAAADRTLSADCEHNIYAFHWATVAVSKITYSFSAGTRDRFTFLLPPDATITELSGANFQDYAELGSRTIQGRNFKIIQARLYRPADKQYELTVRWLAALPEFDRSETLLLVRAAEVARESGTVTLHVAGGMKLQVTQVTAGRRTSLATTQNHRTAERTYPVAKYYWPYRPFSLSLKLSRPPVTPKAALDQLIRIDADRIQLLVQAAIETEKGRLFGTSFGLPKGYELLSVVGPDVRSFYQTSDENTGVVDVTFSAAVTKTKMALVLINNQPELDEFDVPMLEPLDSNHTRLTHSSGRIAVQLAASLDARTLTEQNLKSVPPRTLRDWLGSEQVNATRFAYNYEAAKPSLKLAITPMPTRIDLECFAAMVVRTASADYTYRLRYQIQGSPVDNLGFRLPAEYAPLVAVESPAMRSLTRTQTQYGKTAFNVSLLNEVTGTVDIAVNFSLPIDQPTKTLEVPAILIDTLRSYHAVVAVQNFARHKITIADDENLEELAPAGQRVLIPQQMTDSIHAVFQAFEQNWALAFDITPAEPAARIRAVVDLLAITTVVDTTGTCRYEVAITLQNRSEQFLKVNIPEGLRLWSATVAGRPVKPVKPADASGSQTLIPLVKTSPGGLPYDVFLYLADQDEKRILAPLDGLTRISPPAVTVIGVPVAQTTWSLRLPAGFRYLRPKGNMSPLEDAVEMLALNTDAKIQQLKRLDKTYRDVAPISQQREQVARQNWEVFNAKIAEQIDTAGDYLESNRYRLSQQGYERLRAKLDEQRASQSLIVGSNDAFVRRRKELAQGDMNVFLNEDSVNLGISQDQANEQLLEKPEFVADNERLQIANLTQQLEQAEKSKEQLESAGTTVLAEDYFLEVQDAPTSTTGSIPAGALVRQTWDKKGRMESVLAKANEEAAAQIERQQHQLKKQLEVLADNRAQRAFGLDVHEQTAEAAPAKAPDGRYELRQRRTARGMPVGEPVIEKKEDAADVQTEEQQRYLGVRGPRPIEAPMPYVAAGTYSLPVTLPQAPVTLNFATPSGTPTLSILAVPVRTLHKASAAVAVLALAAIVLAAIKGCPKIETPPLSNRLIVLYIVILAALTILFGLVGIAAAVLIILITTVLRAGSVSRQRP